MKYTLEQKHRLKGVDSLMDLKIKVGKEMGIAQRNFNIVGDFVVIASKLNRYKK